MTILEVIVETDEKNRYSFNEDKTKIRANQGHSTSQVNLKFKEVIGIDEVYHGTTEKTLVAIGKSGAILPMNRQYVHLSKDKDTAFKVGHRHGEDNIVCVIDAKAMIADGLKLFESDNGVILAKKVPAKYITGIFRTPTSEKPVWNVGIAKTLNLISDNNRIR